MKFINFFLFFDYLSLYLILIIRSDYILFDIIFFGKGVLKAMWLIFLHGVKSKTSGPVLPVTQAKQTDKTLNSLVTMGLYEGPVIWGFCLYK